MELKDHIKKVEARQRDGGSEGETVWSFSISKELYDLFRDMMTKEVDRMHNKYTGDGAGTWSCPALGEYDEDFAWVFFGDEDIPLNLYEGADGGHLEIVIRNEPEDKFECLDPQHPHWRSMPPGQWVKILDASKSVLRFVGVNCNG